MDKRFNSSAANFVNDIFEEYLNKNIPSESIKCEWDKKFTTIRIMDSTEFKISPYLSESFPGYNGDGTKACAQIQFEYDLFNGKVENISLENALVSDASFSLNNMSNIKPGSLVLRDLGYYNVNVYKKLESEKVYYISRLKPQINVYELKNKKYRQLSYSSIIKKLRKSQKPYLDMEVYIGRETLHKVRLIANLLDAEAIKNRKRKVKKRRKNFNAQDRYLNYMNLFVTNIENKKVKSNDIYRLYKLRWQIEIIFKGWKSIYKINTVKKMNVHRFKCYLIGKMIWILFTWDIYKTMRHSIWVKEKLIVSVYKSFTIIKARLFSLKKIFTKSRLKIHQWIQTTYGTIIRYGIKEHRKGKVGLEELLRLE